MNEIRIKEDEFKDALIGIGSFLNKPKEPGLRKVAQYCLKELGEHPALPEKQEQWEEENDTLYHLLWNIVDYIRDFRNKIDINYLFHHTHWSVQEKTILKQILNDQDSSILMTSEEWVKFYEKQHGKKPPNLVDV